MDDQILNYRACGAECREDWLRILANENGLPFETVKRLAEQLGEREDFGELVEVCENRGGPGGDSRGTSRNSLRDTFLDNLARSANMISP